MKVENQVQTDMLLSYLKDQQTLDSLSLLFLYKKVYLKNPKSSFMKRSLKSLTLRSNTKSRKITSLFSFLFTNSTRLI